MHELCDLSSVTHSAAMCPSLHLLKQKGRLPQPLHRWGVKGSPDQAHPRGAPAYEAKRRKHKITPGIKWKQPECPLTRGWK